MSHLLHLTAVVRKHIGFLQPLGKFSTLFLLSLNLILENYILSTIYFRYPASSFSFKITPFFAIKKYNSTRYTTGRSENKNVVLRQQINYD